MTIKTSVFILGFFFSFTLKWTMRKKRRAQKLKFKRLTKVSKKEAKLGQSNYLSIVRR